MATDSGRAELERREELVAITTELYGAGLITALGGNVSVRCATRDDAAWITPSQVFKGALRPEDIVLIDLHGGRLQGMYRPSVESIYHAGILRQRPEVGAVVHTHAPLGIAFALCGLPLLPITVEAVIIRDFPTIPFHIGGSPELADAVLQHLGRSTAMGAFLKQHGVVTLGQSLRQAADLNLMVEHTCKILFACKMAGVEPSVIPDETVRRMPEYTGV